jgi:DNA invertase Pin-like site-specific DNA recombinase
MAIKEYTIALYIRLSLEDNNDDESNSVINQRALLNDFLDKHPELSSFKRIEMCDDGVSGVNFERPNIQKLLRMAQNGEIQCVVVKDISRFGRNYIEVGDYVENVFPFLDVRFISVNDNYDSFDNNSSIGSLEVSLRTLVYDLYSKDLSQKVKSAMRVRMEKGEKAGVVFGYKKSPTDKKKLIIDEEPAKIVRFIFDLALEGKKTIEIAKILNAENIPSRSDFKVLQGYTKFYRKDNARKSFWMDNYVYAILTDIQYTGAVASGKRETINVTSKERIRLPKEKWVIIPDMHEPIVTTEEFERVQASFKKNGSSEKRATNKDRILRNIVKCHHCGRSMNRKRGREPFYTCDTPTRIISPECVQGRVNEAEIEKILLVVIQQQVNLAGEATKTQNKRTQQIETAISEMRKSLRQFQEAIERLNNAKQQCYEDYSDGKTDKAEHLKLKAERDEKISYYQDKSNEVSEKLDKSEILLSDNKTAKREYEIYSGITALNREVVDALVESIVVYDSTRIEIVFKHTDIFKGIK